MRNDLSTIERELAASVAGLDPVQTQATPTANPEKWNIQQIVEHLLLSYSTSTTGIEARLAKGTPTLAKPTLQGRLAHFTILTLGRYPSGYQAPAIATPSLPTTHNTGAELVERIHRQLLHSGTILDRAEALFGPQGRISHVRLGPLTASQWRRFHLVHGRHHIRQIQAIRKQHGF